MHVSESSPTMYLTAGGTERIMEVKGTAYEVSPLKRNSVMSLIQTWFEINSPRGLQKSSTLNLMLTESIDLGMSQIKSRVLKNSKSS